jgi:hypothetical protein
MNLSHLIEIRCLRSIDYYSIINLLQYREQYFRFYYNPINLDEPQPYDLKYTVKIIYYIDLPTEDPDPRTAVF